VKRQILLVRDRLENAAPSIARELRAAGMNIRTVSAIELAEAAPAEVVLLAIPAIDPVATCWALHGMGHRWVVAISASPSSQECITLLNAGADYYMDAWLPADELVARVRVVLRFSGWLDESYDHGTLGHQPIPNAAGSRTHQ
jgi:DNA-binding response OmpR family regulator